MKKAIFSAALALMIAGSAQAAITGTFDLSASPTGWDVNDAGAIRQTIYGNTTSTRGFGDASTPTREEGQSMYIDSATTIRSAQFEMTNVQPNQSVKVNVWLAQGSVDRYDVIEGQFGAFGIGSSTYYMYFDEANSQMHEATADASTAVTINGATLLATGTVTTPGSATGTAQHGILTLDLGAIAVSAGDQVVITFTDLSDPDDNIAPWWFYRAATGDIDGAQSTNGLPSGLVPQASYSYTNFVDPDTFVVTPYPGTGNYFETYRFPTVNTSIAGVLIPEEKQLTYQLSSNAIVPEPASLGLLLVGGLMMLRRRHA